MAPPSIATFQAQAPEIEADLRALVEMESPTGQKAALDALGAHVAQSMRGLGAELQRYPQPEAGDHWLGVWGAEPPGILMLAHLDTVHPLGTLKRFPYSADEHRLFGPGILDMKASTAMALTALRVLQTEGGMPPHRVSLLCTSDEETGSHSSSELIQQLAQEHALVLCLEPALPDGALKTWRKGTGLFKLELQGRPAHAGANPGDGINAIHQLAELIPQLAALADEEQGTSISVGLIRGGTRTNVIPARCTAQVDIRVQVLEEQRRLDGAISELKPADPQARLVVKGAWNRPPMPRTPQMVATFRRAQQIGAQIGLELTEGGTGGGSDANFVAPLGIPLLDGLGAVGGGAHTEEEFVLRSSLPERAALLAALLAQWFR